MEMFIKNICKNIIILKKIKTWSVGYTTSVRNKKRKLMSSQGAALNIYQPQFQTDETFTNHNF